MFRKFYALFPILLTAGILSAQEIPASSSYYEAMTSYEPLRQDSSLSEWAAHNEVLSLGFSPEEMESWTRRMEEDLAQWSVALLQKSLEQSNLKSLTRSLETQNGLWLYQRKDSGIEFDAAGDPILRSSDPAEIAADKAQWIQEVGRTRNEILEQWDLNAEVVAAGILNDVPAEFQTTVIDNLQISVMQYRKRVTEEADRFIQWASVNFDSIREDDLYSLRKKSEDETAESLSERLVNETRLALTETDKTLNEGIRELQDATVQDASFSIENWDESFQREFQKGLQHWAEAEDALVAERLKWELRTEDKYLEAEESWDKAFAVFSQSRKSWIQEITLQIEEGRKVWDAKEESFSQQFDSIAYEIEKAAVLQENKFSDQVQSAIELYRESLALLASSDESIRYYQGKIDEIIPGYNVLLAQRTSVVQKQTEVNTSLANAKSQLATYQNILASDDSSLAEKMEVLDKLQSVVKQITSLEVFMKPSLDTRLFLIEKEIARNEGELSIFNGEISNWQTLNTSLKTQLADSRKILIRLETEATGYDETVPVGTLENEIERMNGVSEYLYSQWLISEAVVEYAEMDSSARPTEAQTEIDYENADQNFTGAEQNYQSAIAALTDLRTKLAQGQISLADSRVLMEEARSKMIASQQEYDTAFAIYQSNNPAIIEQMIKDLENELTIWFDGGHGVSPMRNNLYISFIQASEYEARQVMEEERQRVLRDLQGEEDEGETNHYTDTGDLQTQFESLKGLEPDLDTFNSDDWRGQLFKAGIPRDSDEFISLTSLYNACFSGSDQLRSKLELQTVLKNSADSMEMQLLQNQESIALLGNPPPAEGESGETIEKGLKKDVLQAENQYYYAKAVLLREIFTGLESGMSGDEPWKEYADYLALQEEPDSPLEGLETLIGILNDLNEGTLNRAEALSSLDESGMEWFLIVTGEKAVLPGQNYLDLYLKNESEVLRSAAAELASWQDMKPWLIPVHDDFKRNTLLLESTDGEQFYKNLESFNSLEELLQWYQPLYENESVPEYFKTTINRYISLHYGQALSEAETESDSLAAELVWIEKQLDKFGIDEADIQNSLRSEDCSDILAEAGFTQELQDWQDYKTLLEWKLYFRDAEDLAWTEALEWAEENESEVIEPEIDKEALFQSFLAETSRSGIELSDLEEFDFSGHDYSMIDAYSDWSDTPAEEYLAQNYPDAGYIETQLLKIMMEGSERSLNNLWYHISNDLFHKMLDIQRSKSSEYGRVQLLLSLRNLEHYDPDIVRDQSFVKAMIQECARIMLSQTPGEPLESSQALWTDFQNQQFLSESNRKKIIKLNADLDISRKDSEKYKADVVDVLFNQYRLLEKEFDNFFVSYQNQIDQFDIIQKEYLEGQSLLNDAYLAYQNAAAAFQQAGEILNFAQTGYSPETSNVYGIKDERQRLYENAVSSLQVLQDIRDSGKNNAHLDPQWLESVKKSEQLLSLNNNLGYTQEALVKELGELNRQYNKTLGALTKNAQDIFSFPEGFQFDPGQLNDTLTDFSSWSNGSLKTMFDNYIKNPKEYTKDVVQWMIEMDRVRTDSSLLETFSYAYYNELRSMGKSWSQIESEYGVNLFSTTYHDSLLNQGGTFFQSVHIGYEGDMNKYWAGGYETVYKEFRNVWDDTPVIYKVYISPEEWLKDRTQQYTNTINSNSQLKKLYSFYKVMMFNGRFSGNSLKMGMSMDLSVLAWDYLRPVAKGQRNKFKRWLFGGYRDPGDNINSWMNSINNSISSGTAKRESIFDSLQAGSGELAALKSNVQKRNTLTASENLNIDSLQNIIRMVTGITLNPEQKEILTQSFDSLSAIEKSSSMIALQSLQKALILEKQISDQKVLRRENELRNDQQILYTQLLTEYNRDDFDLDSYRTIARHLYENPSYLEEDYKAARFGSIWSADRPSEHDSLYTMTAYGQQLVRSFQNRMDLVKKDRYTSLQEELEGLYGQRQFWEDRINELFSEGMDQWNLSTQRLIGHRMRWRDDFERDYQYKTGLWESKYKLLIRNKNTWIQNSSEAAVSSGTYAMARDMNLDAQSLMGEVNFSLIPDISVEPGDMDRIVNDSLEGTTVYKLLAGVRSMTSRAGTHDLILSATLPAVPDTTRAMDSLQEKQLILKEDISKALALAQAYQMKDAVDKTRESILDNIADANKGVDEGVESQLRSTGYARNGSMFSRDVIIDSSLLGGNENELQEIKAYNYFKAPSFDVGVNLDVHFMQNLDSSMIQAGVKLAQERLYNYMNLIFGNGENKDNNPVDIRTGLDESFIQYLENQEAAFKSSAQYNRGYKDANEEWHDSGKHTETRGLFYFHVGYAPEMDEDDPEEVDVDGYGEMGRIYEKFMIQQARLMRGLSTMTVPWYSQKIWDDDANNDGDSDGLIGAPSIRTVADIALTVAGTAMGMGPFPAMMLSLVDDALFTVADIGNGAMDAGSAALGFVKKAGVSLLSYGAGQMTSGLDKLATFKGFGSQALEVSTDIANTALNTTVNNFGSAAINSITADGFNLDGFNSMTSWDSMKMGYISGMAGTAVNSSLELGTFGFIGDAYKDSAKFTSMMGGLTSTGLQYAMSGEVQLNVMNLGGTGVLELNLGGDGNLFNFGTGGTDVSLGALTAAGRGLEAYSKNIEIRKNVEDKRLWAGMRTLYSTAEGTETKSLYNDVISGNAEFLIGTGQSYDGRTTADSGKRYVELNTDGKSRLDLAVLMSHEAYRDGYDNGAQGQDEERFKAAVGHMQVSSALQSIYGNRTLSSHNNDEADLFNKVVRGEISGNLLSKYIDESYDSTADYWKFTSDGNIVFDGSKNLYDENGKLLDEYEGSGGFTDSLSAMLGISSEDASQMMKDAGWSWDDGTFMAGDQNALNNPNLALSTSDQLKAKYFVQRDYVDKLWSKYGGDMNAMTTAMQEDLFTSSDGDFNSIQSAMLGMSPGFRSLADQMDIALYGETIGASSIPGMLNQERFDDYFDSNVADVFRQIKDGWSYDNSNPMYRLIGDGKPIDPIEGGDYVTTRSKYENGNEHGWNGGEAVDFGTDRENHPLFTTQFETIRTNDFNLGWDKGDINSGTGYTLKTDSELFGLKYGHMQPSSFASYRLQNLINSANQTDLWRFDLPPGYQFGNVGNSGNSTGVHFHWEFYPY